ncbi:MAG: acetyl-CoA carboxylase biotin carboxyl carrier protein [Coriobacteriia bacterium]|nr:acetyl-CoA carboxylase biotin carboxyl carrier protein [Coriobacteriia bacterium]MBS5477134.1 acetyl-CoA carboxylase biotin carboxyl carrier protein [Coriobacteriia bacterium]
MDLETLRGIVELMEQHDLSHVKIDDESGKIELDRGPKVAPTPAPVPPVVIAAASGFPGAAPTPAPAPAPASPASASTPAPAPAAPAPKPADDGSREVSAPMVGVFYAAPAPGADPFVTVGSKVKKGDTLCIVEAMKCMNEIAAECDGTIVDICVSDGELVEYGRCLMKISE